MDIEFRALDNGITNLAGSGLGFYGASFGSSVNIGSWQDGTWVTNSDGSIQGAQAHNVKWTHANSGSINGLTGINLLNMPNQLATLNIRFTNGTAVKTQNAKLRIYDRSNINNGPSGVTCRVAEIIHPSVTQTGNLGSGNSSWTTMSGGVVLNMSFSPGISGLLAKPSTSTNTADTRHDYFVNITSSPNSVGSKLFALYFEVEYY